MLLFEVLAEELEGGLVGLGGGGGVGAAETVFAIGENDQAVFDLVFVQFGGHLDRFAVRNVGVLVAVNEKRGGINGRHIFDGKER